MTRSSAPLPEGDIPVSFDGQNFTLVLDWAAIAFFERESGASLLELYAGLLSGVPKLSLMAYLLLAGLQRHHPEIDLDQAGRMSLDEGVRAALDLATTEAMPTADQSAEGNAAGTVSGG